MEARRGLQNKKMIILLIAILAGSVCSAQVVRQAYTVKPGQWVAMDGAYEVPLLVPRLTNPFGSAVSVTMVKDTVLFIALPATDIFSNGDHINYTYKAGTVSIWYFTKQKPEKLLQFNVVIVK
jgi:hypothetical protein